MDAVSDPSTVDLTRTRLALRSGVRVVPQVYGDEVYYHIEDPTSGQYFRVGYTEYVFLSLLDGRTTYSEALAITARTQSATALPQHQAMALYCWLLEMKLADFADSPDSRSQSAKAGHRQQPSLLTRLNPFWIRIPAGRPDRLLELLQPCLGWCFSLPATLLALVLFVAAGLQLSVEWSRFSAASVTVFSTDNWAWLLIAWIGLKCVHETAHGLVSLRYGGTVRDSGIILAFLAPLAYVDVTSSWGFPSRWHRIHVAAAGMYAELVVASLAVFGWTLTDSAVVSHLLYNVIIMASVSTLVFNANPLMKFDGYYILSDLLQIPNLASRAAEAVQQAAGRVLLGIRTTAPTATGHTVWLLRLYGIAALAWRLFICLSLMIAGSVLFHGAGLVLSVAGAAAWWGLPIYQGLTRLQRLSQEAPVRLARGVVLSGVLLAGVAALLLGLPFPFAATAPGIVELPEGSTVRAGVDGFIRQICVDDGQLVEPGQLLLRLENDQVIADHADLQLQIRQETVRLQTAVQDHEAATANVVRSNLASLQERLQETTRQVSLLEVRAAERGRVVARDLESRHDTFVQEGQELLVVDTHQPRELRISIAQDDFALARARAGEALSVRIGTRAPIQGILQRFTPRASRRLAFPALAATAGGPLPVTSVREETDSQSREELTTERFDAVVQLPPETARSLYRGERGYVALGLRDVSIATHLYRQSVSWLRQTVQLAKDGHTNESAMF